MLDVLAGDPETARYCAGMIFRRGRGSSMPVKVGGAFPMKIRSLMEFASLMLEENLKKGGGGRGWKA